MGDEIRVHVVAYPGRVNLMMRYRDPTTGKQVARTTGTNNDRKALKAAATWEAELRDGRYQRPQRITWAEFREQFTTEKLDSMKVGTAATYLATFNVLEELAPIDRLASLTTARITTFVTELRKLGRRPATIARHLRGLKVAARWAHRQGLLLKLPLFDMPKQSKGMRGRPITTEEFERMLGAVEKTVGTKAAPSWKFYLRGLWASGLRLSESLRLRWDDGPEAVVVDYSGRRPMLRVAAEAEKGDTHRILPMAPELAQLLETVPLEARVGWVFRPLAKSGDAMSRVGTNVGPIISAIGAAAKVVVDQRQKLDDEGELATVNAFAGAHDLRRAFGYRWSRKIMPTLLRELMRHESLDTTMRYYVGTNAQATAAALWDAVGNISGNIAPATTPAASGENAVSR